MIHVFPIESYDSRYTEQWNRWFPAFLRSKSVDFHYYSTSEGGELDEGEVLDPFMTHLHKFEQLKQAVKSLRDGGIASGDVLFFHDLWFPGLEALEYIRNIREIEFKIVGVLHAGSYDPADFTVRAGMTRWAQHSERSWLEFIDEVFVATAYHRDLLIESGRGVREERIFVTGLPLDVDELRSGRPTDRKRPVVAFPHRNVPEKDPGRVERLKRALPDVEIVRTREVTTTKSEYYDLLARCRICVSNSHQETFGYAMAESALLGCVPLVPDRLAYVELYPREFRYRSEEELVEKIRRFLEFPVDPVPQLGRLTDLCEGAIGRMVERCLA